MWIFIILIVVAIILFLNYNTDKKELHSRVEQKGGMDQIFQPFIHYIEDDFKTHRIILNSNTELEILATTHDGKTFCFGIKLGFGNKVIYRCDTKRSNVLNADLAVEGNKSDQIAPYMMILDELRKKYTFITNDEQIVNETNRSNSIKNDSLLASPSPVIPTDELLITTQVESEERPEILQYTDSTKKSRLIIGDKPIREISISYSMCTFMLEDFTTRRFDVLGTQISEDGGRSFREGGVKTIDGETIITDMNLYRLMVLSTKAENGPDGESILFLKCENNIECDILSGHIKLPTTVVVRHDNIVTLFSVVEVTNYFERLLGRI
jgi:hypothetical protein